LLDSKDDIQLCELALSHGIKSYGSGSVQRRLNANKHFVEVITAELTRRLTPAAPDLPPTAATS